MLESAKEFIDRKRRAMTGKLLLELGYSPQTRRQFSLPSYDMRSVPRLGVLR